MEWCVNTPPSQFFLRRSARLEFLVCLIANAIMEMVAHAESIAEALKTKQDVDEFLKLERLQICRGCPAYNKKLSSCGNPFTPNNVLQYGCKCHCPTIASVHHDCWAYSAGYEFGWPERLNSSYLLNHEQRDHQG